MTNGVTKTKLDIVLRSSVWLYVGFLVILPMATLAHWGLKDGLSILWRAIYSAQASDALILTLWSAALVSLVNVVMGTATAWVLVRYPFRGKQLFSSLIDLPLAIPTLVTGLMIVVLYGPNSPLAPFLDAIGIGIVFNIPAILLALAFITLPFAVRTVEPILAELDTSAEEAAATLGAGPFTTFRRVILPSIAPGMAAGAMQCFARAIAEFGSIIVVSGNIPSRTLTAPVYIFGEVESGRADLAAAVSLVLLALALMMTIGSHAAVRHKGEADD